jgi:hypothetical protein
MIKNNKKQFNSHTWEGLTTGKLLFLAQITGKEAEYNPLAHDIFHEIANYFYETDKPSYEYIQKYHKS